MNSLTFKKEGRRHLSQPTWVATVTVVAPFAVSVVWVWACWFGQIVGLRGFDDVVGKGESPAETPTGFDCQKSCTPVSPVILGVPWPEWIQLGSSSSKYLSWASRSSSWTSSHSSLSSTSS